MVLLPSLEDLSAGSGIINMPFLENVYHSVMDEALMDLGGDRGPVTLHLQPIVEQDNTTQGQAAPQQYNPFFGRVPVPQANTRNTGTKITPRDVQYTGHIVVGPRLKRDDDLHGIGELKDNEAVATIVIEALPHVKETLSVSIEGRRYSIDETRPIGFTKRRYLMLFMTEIQETETPSPDGTLG